MFKRSQVVIHSCSLQESASNEQNTQPTSKGAEIRPFDVSSVEAVSGLKGVDILISTINLFNLVPQPKLVDAADAAGVKLFVPVEFQDTTDGRSGLMFQNKVAL